MFIREGIPSYVERDTYWQIASQPRLRALLEGIERHGWERGTSGLTAFERQYWTNPDRAGFATLLPGQSFRAVLDIGCGAGAITTALAPMAREIWGIDLCLESLLLLQARAAHLGQGNVRLAHADARELPFPNRKFDLLVMNGVLERVGYAGSHRDVDHSQRVALAEAARVLEPGGTLYVGIENRFGANYLLGARDEHTHLRWVNVLPRRVANLYSRLVRRRPFTAFTHSYLGLRRRLREAGFQSCEFWCPLPTYREIKLLIRLETDPLNLCDSVAQVYPQRVPGWLLALSRCVPARAWRHLSPHFAVVARR